MTDTLQNTWVFSLITGEIYSIQNDEVKNLDEYQVPLKRLPKPSCSACYGRLHKGFFLKHKLYKLCNKCGPKCIDLEKLKSLVVPSNAN